VLALIEELGGPAVVVGNSMGAGAAAWAAAERPDLISDLVLVGPFVRNPEVSAINRAVLRFAMTPAWAALSWKAYLPRLYAGHKPADLDRYLGNVHQSLKRPGYAKAFAATTRTDHAQVQARLGDVQARTLVVMGELDPDFPSPRAEADWIAATLHGKSVMVADAGHYPQSQQPEVVTSAIVGFLAEAGHRA
jgi:pimeloyl-ACP methyl ester carboxylesterase